MSDLLNKDSSSDALIHPRLADCQWTIWGWENIQKAINEVLHDNSVESQEAILLSILNVKLHFPSMRFFCVRCIDTASGAVASCYAMEYPGKLATIVGPTFRIPHLESPNEFDSVLEAAMGDSVLRQLIKLVDQWNSEIIQSVFDVDQPSEKESLARVGFRQIALLQQMYVDLYEFTGNQTPGAGQAFKELAFVGGIEGPYRWQRFTPDQTDKWIAWLDETYRQTQDCPSLNGIRSTSATLEGYEAMSGVKTQGLDQIEWWALTTSSEDQIVAAIMLSYNGNATWEVCYMGVIPSYRGRQLGRILLSNSIEHVRRLGGTRLWLAVDSRNTVAYQLYRELGFDCLASLEAWMYRPGCDVSS